MSQQIETPWTVIMNTWDPAKLTPNELRGFRIIKAKDEAFRLGHASRDEEVKRLREALDAFIRWFHDGFEGGDPSVGIQPRTECCICDPDGLGQPDGEGHVIFGTHALGCPVPITEAALKGDS